MEEKKQGRGRDDEIKLNFGEKNGCKVEGKLRWARERKGWSIRCKREMEKKMQKVFNFIGCVVQNSTT